MEIERQQFRKFLGKKRPDSDGKALQQTVRIILLSLVYPLQYPLVCFIKGLGQFVQILAEVWRDAMLQRVQLAEYPPEPVK